MTRSSLLNGFALLVVLLGIGGHSVFSATAFGSSETATIALLQEQIKTLQVQLRKINAEVKANGASIGTLRDDLAANAKNDLDRDVSKSSFDKDIMQQVFNIEKKVRWVNSVDDGGVILGKYPEGVSFHFQYSNAVMAIYQGTTQVR